MIIYSAIYGQIKYWKMVGNHANCILHRGESTQTRGRTLDGRYLSSSSRPFLRHLWLMTWYFSLKQLPRVFLLSSLSRNVHLLVKLWIAWCGIWPCFYGPKKLRVVRMASLFLCVKHFVICFINKTLILITLPENK